jgi:hypothetical protein
MAHRKHHLPFSKRYIHYCKLCLYGSNELGALVAHMAKRHPDQSYTPTRKVQPEKASKSTQCKICGTVVSSSRYLKNWHIGSQRCKPLSVVPTPKDPSQVPQSQVDPEPESVSSDTDSD